MVVEALPGGFPGSDVDHQLLTRDIELTAGSGDVGRQQGCLADGRERDPLRRPLVDAGSGGLVSTLEDYGRFGDMLANGGTRGGTRVMEPASVRLLTTAYGPQAPLLPSLTRFGNYEAGSVAQALGGIVRVDDRAGPGGAGEYAWGGAAGTGFWATPGLGLSVTVMTQLMPVAAMPARDLLRPLVYAAL